jgi:hypothetical protein
MQKLLTISLMVIFYCVQAQTKSESVYFPRSLEDYRKFSAVDQVRNFNIRGAQVLHADYELIKSDFPFLSQKNDQEIDNWLIENMTSISERQLLLQNIRTTEVPTTGETTVAYRQRHNGRGDFIEVKDPSNGEIVGYIDRKGSGVHYKHLDRNILEFNEFGGDVNKLRMARKTNGLLYLSEGLRELHMDTTRHLLDYLRAQRNNTQFLPEVINNYALIKLPFEILSDTEGETQPASLILRQANLGRVWIPRWSSFKEHVKADGSDALMRVVDAGSLYFNNKNLIPFFDVNWVRGPNSIRGLHGVGLMSVFLEAVMKSNNPREVVEDHLQQMSRQLKKLKKQTGIPDRVKPPQVSLDEALSNVFLNIIDQPLEYANFLKVIDNLHRRGQTEILEQPIVKEAIRAVLYLDPIHVTITDMKEEIPTRYRAFHALPLLPLSEVIAVINEETRTEGPNVGMEMLAETAWLFNYKDIQHNLSKIVDYNPLEFVSSLKVKLMEPDLANDPRLGNYKAMARFAFLNPSTQAHALELFVDLIKNRNPAISARDITGSLGTLEKEVVTTSNKEEKSCGRLFQ